MLYPTIPGLLLLAGATSVTVVAAAGLRNRPEPIVQAAATTPEKTQCEAFNRSIVEATARLRNSAEAARLNALHKDCSRSF